MPIVVLASRAEAQIIDVLEYTLERFGEAKYLEYRDLVHLTLTTLKMNPTHGKRRPEIHADAWTYHIAVRVAERATCSFPGFGMSSKSPVSCTTRWTCLASGPGNGNDRRGSNPYPLIRRFSGSYSGRSDTRAG